MKHVVNPVNGANLQSAFIYQIVVKPLDIGFPHGDYRFCAEDVPKPKVDADGGNDGEDRKAFKIKPC